MEGDLCPKCSVCLKEFSDANVPRNLDCGHAVCSLCIEQLISVDNSCPECRQEFSGESPEDFSINHPILRLSRIFSFEKLDQGVIPPLKSISNHIREPLQSLGTCPEHGHSLFFICLRCIEAICRGCLAVNHPDLPSGLCTIAPLQGGMDKLKASYQESLESQIKESKTSEEKSRTILRMFTVILEQYQETEKKEGKKIYDTCIPEITDQMEKIQIYLKAAEPQRNNLDEVLTELKEAKDPKGLKKVLEKSQQVEKAYEKFRCDAMKTKVEQVVKPFLPSDMDIGKLMETGTLLYAIQDLEGKSRWARIVAKDNKILLYSLRDGNPPEGGVHLPYWLVQAFVPRESPTVFMDFEGEGEYKMSACIRMFGDTARGRQAVLLCSGERGPSYRNTDFYELYSHEDDDPCLKGGDYENNDGTGGRAIVDDITDDDIYKMPVDEGLMVGWPAAETHRLGSFRIYPFDYSDWMTTEHGFGVVIDGMDFVCNTLGSDQGEEFENSKVMDCGLVLKV